MNRAHLFERIALNRNRARELRIAELDTADWRAIAADACPYSTPNIVNSP